jgi:hypothetical protein
MLIGKEYAALKSTLNVHLAMLGRVITTLTSFIQDIRELTIHTGIIIRRRHLDGAAPFNILSETLRPYSRGRAKDLAATHQ